MFRLFILTLICVNSIQTKAQTIQASTTSGCPPLITSFSHNFSNVQSVAWNFGDNTTSNLSNPGKIYNVSGSFTVSATLTFNNGTTQTITLPNYIQVKPLPTINFSYSLVGNNTCSDTVVANFTDTGSNIVRRLWDFGDGTVSSITNPSHTYSSSGPYQVVLQVWSADSCMSVVQKTINILIKSKPSGSINFNDTTLCRRGTAVVLRPSNLRGSIVKYQWTFSGGIPNYAVSNPNVVFPNSGNYQITLRLTSNNGCVDSVTKNVTVNYRNSIPRVSPIDSFICVGFPVTFNTIDTIRSIFWRFGDGSTASTAPFLKTYTRQGTFPVTAVTTDTLGCLDTILRMNVIVGGTPRLTVSYRSNRSCQLPITVNFNSSGTNGNTIKYFFSDSTGVIDSASQFNFSKSFNRKGIIRVSARLSNSSCSYDTSFNILIQPLTLAMYVASTDSGCSPLNVSFRDSSSIMAGDSIVSYFWDFGNGNTGTSSTANQVFSGFRTFAIRYAITTLNGCTDTLYNPVGVRTGNRPTSFFVNPDTAGCAPVRRILLDNSTNTISNSSYFWNFGDGRTSTQKDPGAVTYKAPGKFNVTHVVGNYGCLDTFVRVGNVEVFPPKAKIGSTPTIGCSIPFTVNFSDSSAGSVTRFWTFTDPATGRVDTTSAFSPSFTYNSYGAFNVKLVVTSALGCIDSIDSRGFVKTADPKPGFVAIDSVGCRPFRANMQNLSTPGTYTWWFGNISVSNPTFLFNTPGKFNVKLVMVDSIGCVDSVSVNDQVWVKGQKPNFSGTPITGCMPLTSTFTPSNLSLPAIVSFAWNFGDSTSSSNTDTTLSPSHLYTLKGAYDVSLSVTDTDGCVNTIVKPRYVQSSNPIANFQVQPIGCINVPVQFSDRSSMSGLQHFWSFGDGGSSTATNPTHVYTNSGRFTVRLIISNGNGCTDTVTKTNIIEIQKVVAKTVVNRIVSYCAPQTVTLQDTSIGTTSWRWDFGDSSSSILRNPTHTFNRNGYFNVTLIASNINGCADTLTLDSMVHIIGPVPSYSYVRSQNCAPAIVTFTNTSKYSVSALWDFRDGRLSTAYNATNVYTQSGNFNPILIARDSLGCTATYAPTLNIKVDTVPTALFTATPTEICGSGTVNFTNRSTGNPTSYSWNFSNGQTLTTVNASQYYNIPGSYAVSLIATNQHGCKDTFSLASPINVYEKPVARFSTNASPKNCTPASVQFYSSSTPAAGSSISSFVWNFGNGTTLNGSSNVSTTYAVAGLYQASLVVTDNHGCKDSVALQTKINIIDSTSSNQLTNKFVSIENDRNIRLMWSPTTDTNFVAYFVYRKNKTAGSNFVQIARLPFSTDTIFIDNAVAVDTNIYSYLVLQENYCGKVSSMNTVLAHSSILLNAKPSVDVKKNGVDINWSAYEGWVPTSYEIYRKTTGNNRFNKIASIPGTETSYTDTNLCPNIYNYYVEAIGSNGYVSTSNQTGSRNSIFVLNSGIDMVNASVVSENQVAISFYSAPILNIDKYQVFRSDNGGQFLRIAELNPTDTTYTDFSTFTSSNQYSYKIKVKDQCGNLNPLGNEGSSILLQVSAKKFEVTLTWNEYLKWANGVDKYIVERLNPRTNVFEQIAVLPATARSFQEDPAKLNFDKYIYRVKAIEKGGNQMTSISNEAGSTLDATLFVPTAFSPNRDGTNDEFRVVGLHIKTIQIEVFNRWGEKIFETTDINQAWDGTFKGEIVEAGTYIIQVQALNDNGMSQAYKGLIHVIK